MFARGCRQMVDPVWEHGEKVGNGWKCKYCHEQRNGGGATRLKEHLAQRGKDAKDCHSVPHEVKTFFNRELDRIRGKKNGKGAVKDEGLWSLWCIWGLWSLWL